MKTTAKINGKITAETRKMPKILLVEDDTDLCEGWKDLFELLDFDFKIFNNAKDLLDNSDRLIDADILITDYYLPDLNGYELSLRARKMNEFLPILVLTGSREPSVIEDVKKLDNAKLILKPLNIDVLEREIDAAIA